MAYASIMHFPFFPVLHLDYFSGAQKLHNEGKNAIWNEKIWENKENKKKYSSEKENKKRSRQQDKLDDFVHKKKKLRHDQGSEFFDSFRGWKKDLSDQRERSGVTEEQGLPSVPNPCNSLESTQNSNKKSKLLVADIKRKDQGLVLRIKLPLIKHKEPITSNTSTVPCTSHGAAAATNIIQTSSAAETSSLNDKTLGRQQKLHSAPANEDPSFSGRVSEAPMIEEGTAAAATAATAADDLFSSNCGSNGDSRRNRRRLKIAKCFSDLVLNWNPSSLQPYNDLNPSSQDWLFAPPSQSHRGNQSSVSSKASKPDREVVLVSSASFIQPQACYLPEYDIYQLPYVIPF